MGADMAFENLKDSRKCCDISVSVFAHPIDDDPEERSLYSYGLVVTMHTGNTPKDHMFTSTPDYETEAECIAGAQLKLRKLMDDRKS